MPQKHTDRGRGRSDTIDQRITFRASETLINAIDAYAEDADDITNRSQAIRELLSEAMAPHSQEPAEQHES